MCNSNESKESWTGFQKDLTFMTIVDYDVNRLICADCEVRKMVKSYIVSVLHFLETAVTFICFLF